MNFTKGGDVLPQNRFRTDWNLSLRMFITMFLLAALYLGFALVLFRAGAGALTMAVVIGLMLGLQYYYSSRLVLWSMGARLVDEREQPELHALVERLAVLADIPKPRVAVVNTPVPNAFATGRNEKNAVVAFTTGLLSRLSQAELEGVVAHELSHIRNRDMVVMTLASFFAAVASFIVQRAFFWGVPGGMGRGNQGANPALLIYLASLVVWVVSYFLIRALSRYREYAADRGAAYLTGSPSNLASALLKISGAMERIPDRDLRQSQSANAFMIIPAFGANSWFELFSTHPALNKRLDHLKKLELELEGRAA
jgi:heat shock protein HtpX